MVKTLKYAFRITHIDNIPHIMKFGLVSINSPHRNANYVSIGDRQVIRIRGEREIGEMKISDYIPFYLGPRSPMLYVIQRGYNGVKQVDAEDIVYCVIRIDDLVRNNIDCIFTDGHALSYLTNTYSKEYLPKIDDYVNFDDVYSTMWTLDTDIDLKRRKEAELLIKNDLPLEFIKGFVVYNEKAKKNLETMGINPDLIAVVPTYYF